MKIFPAQSVCPHCKTVYRYGDLNAIKFKKQTVCYHCRKTIHVKKAGVWWLLLEMLILYALLNVILLGFVQGLSLLALFIINIIPAAAAVVLLPLYLELRK